MHYDPSRGTERGASDYGGHEMTTVDDPTEIWKPREVDGEVYVPYHDEMSGITSFVRYEYLEEQMEMRDND